MTEDLHRATPSCEHPSSPITTHHHWVQLEAAMRGAEGAVLREMGYKIKLKEK